MLYTIFTVELCNYLVSNPIYKGHHDYFTETGNQYKNILVNLHQFHAQKNAIIGKASNKPRENA